MENHKEVCLDILENLFDCAGYLINTALKDEETNKLDHNKINEMNRSAYLYFAGHISNLCAIIEDHGEYIARNMPHREKHLKHLTMLKLLFEGKDKQGR